MKTPIIILALMFSALAASAQEKLWTWTPPNAKDWYVLHASEFQKDGSCAFVMAHVKGEKTTYLLVWVTKNGKPVLTREVQTKDSWETALAMPQGSRWQLAFLKLNTLAASDGAKLLICTSKDGAKATVKELPQTGVVFDKSAGFAGWLEQKSETGYLYFSKDGADLPSHISYDTNYDVKVVRSLSGWKL
jgi:hypothetical protein